MSDNTTKTLHFNFTPVQSFVAQARRTRDLWAGSYLLAWLSGQALNAILEDKDSRILMPYVDEDLLMAAIKDPNKFFHQRPEEERFLVKSLGTLPNRFSALIPENKDPDDYAKVIQGKWIELANAVRNRVDPNKSIINDKFWKRQIENHWEFAWVIGEASYLLDSRKNLRLPRITEESGEKCTVCGQRQELSESMKAPPFKPDRKASKAWWASLRESDLDLRENERLCAVCLTKRLFPLVAIEAIGWQVEQYYPSTAYLAAIDWLEEVLKKAKTNETIRNAANELAGTVEQLKIHKSEYNTHIQGLSDYLEASGINKSFLDLDGDVFYLSSIDTDQLQKRNNNACLLPLEKRTLSASLKKLQEAVVSSATPFYALLLMDGDGMGKLIGDSSKEDRKNLSRALADFTGQVPDIVKKHNGKLIYAGGDDVFALLPVSKAIRCAAECRAAYQNAFAQQTEALKNAATISAAVQFAHQNIALSVVVKGAHHLLDDIAKNRTGRDALACRVWKPGGITLTWSQPWTDNSQTDFVELLDKVIADFKPDSQSDRFSSKFFYKLPDLFALIQSDNNITEKSIQDLLVAEYLANREHNWTIETGKDEASSESEIEKKRGLAKERVVRLMQLCQQQTRIMGEDRKISHEKGGYQADAALLVRFLVQKEV